MPKVGVLKDISSDGLSFEYLFDNHSEPTSNHVDIWMSGAEFFVREMPCERVYDNDSPQNMEYFFISTTRMRRCGLKFGALSAEQSAKLSSFIIASTNRPV